MNFGVILPELIGREAGASFSETLLKMGPPLDTTTQREFLRKIHELAPARETYLFVDDYHLVEGEMMTGFVLFISRNLPKHIHVVLISRICGFEHQRQDAALRARQ